MRLPSTSGLPPIESGPLFRPASSRHKDELAARGLTHRAMYGILMGYFWRLPSAMQEKEIIGDDGKPFLPPTVSSPKTT